MQAETWSLFLAEVDGHPRYSFLYENASALRDCVRLSDAESPEDLKRAVLSRYVCAFSRSTDLERPSTQGYPSVPFVQCLGTKKQHEEKIRDTIIEEQSLLSEKRRAKWVTYS